MINRVYYYRDLLLFLLIAANLMVTACTGPEEPARFDYIENGNKSMTLERSYKEVFAFDVLPAAGPGTIPESGNTVDLLLNMPYLLTSGLIPPEFVINERTGQIKVNLIDKASGSVIRHIPSTELAWILRNHSAPSKRKAA